MDINSEFNDCVDEVNKLRTEFLKMTSPRSSLLDNVYDLAQKQISCLETVNNFFVHFSESAGLTERLENSNETITMPDQQSALNLIDVTKSALEICCELTPNKNSGNVPEEQQRDIQKNNLNRFIYYDINNKEFNKNFEKIIQYYASTTPEAEEFSDSTVNTIVSDDVLASSPI